MKKKIKELIRFTIHNNISSTAIFLALTHFILTIEMIHYEITELAIFNSISTILYLIGLLLCLKGQNLYAYLITIMEVTACIIISVLFLGWASGFALYIYSLIPAVIFYSNSVITKHDKSLSYIVALFAILLFLELFQYTQLHSPIYYIPHNVSLFFYIFNVLVTTLSITMFSIFYNITIEFKNDSLINLNKQLEQDASNDSLTGLLNRRGLIPLIEEAINEKKNFCVAFCDIDDFKQVNDHYGHDAGDEVLKHVSSIIKKEMQGCNICRWGGEEFVILMKDYDIMVAAKKMDYIRKVIEKSATHFYSRKIPVTITVGIEEYKEHHKDADSIIKVADSRMYNGKQNGKNKVICA